MHILYHMSDQLFSVADVIWY